MTVEDDDLVRKALADGIEQLVVGAVITRAGGSLDRPEVLVLDRNTDDFMGGIEELPSGKVESDETLLEALRREVHEETGLTMRQASSFAFSFDYLSGTGRRSRQFNFVVETHGDEVAVDPAQHVGFRWVPLTGLADS